MSIKAIVIDGIIILPSIKNNVMLLRNVLIIIFFVFCVTLASGYTFKAPLAWVVSAVINLSVCAWLIYSKKVKPAISLKRLLILIPVFVGNFATISIFFKNVEHSQIFAFTIASPITEEIFFRGLFLDGVSSNKKKQIWLSSLVFSIWHLKNIFVLPPIDVLNQMLYVLFVIGPIFAWMKLKYKSLFPSMLTHTLYNTINSFDTWLSLLGLMLTWFTLLVQIHSKDPKISSTTVAGLKDQ